MGGSMRVKPIMGFRDVKWIVSIVIIISFLTKESNHADNTMTIIHTVANEGAEIYRHDTTDLPSAVACTAEQRNQIPKTLNLGRDRGLNCPKATWIELYYKEGRSSSGEISMSPFLGISVGCNKGHDAIQTARMGMSNSEFDGPVWKNALGSVGAKYAWGACGAENQEQFVTAHTKREGEMHCIEPMPSTYIMLRDAAKKLSMKEKNFTVTNAAISSSNGMAKFPSGSAGIEYENIDSCQQNPKYCLEVPMFTLDTYVKQFVRGKGPVDILQIDTEGWDFDVLFGAGPVLDRTNYLEFEYHITKPWGDLHLQDAIKLLDRKGFTCYWAGVEKLWKITECYSDVYDQWHGWSNIACVHRNVEKLARLMEDVFLSTIS